MFFATVRRHRGPQRIPLARGVARQARETYQRRPAPRLELLGAQLKLLKAPPEESSRSSAAPTKSRRACGSGWRATSARYVYWIERRGAQYRSPGHAHRRLVDSGTSACSIEVDSIVLTSATLAVGGRFDFTKARLGVRNARPLIVPSHFDYATGAALRAAGAARSAQPRIHRRRRATRSSRCSNCSRGRAFVLFTSYQQMRAALRSRLAGNRLSGAAARHRSAQRAARRIPPHTRNCVLFATSSFWQGVDVPGEQLSCVIIDKLPFAVPSDPVVEARIAAIRENGGNAVQRLSDPPGGA